MSLNSGSLDQALVNPTIEGLNLTDDLNLNDNDLIVDNSGDKTLTPAELAILDGLLATTAELNHIQNASSEIQAQINAITTLLTNLSQTELGTLNDVVSTLTGIELNSLDGISSNVQDQFTAKAPIANPTFTGEIGIGAVNVSETELGTLEGILATATELNHMRNASSEIQAQIDSYNMIGSANEQWVPCIYAATSNTTKPLYVNASGQLDFAAGTKEYRFDLPLPKNRGSKSLYISGTKLVVQDADGAAKIDQVIVQSLNEFGAAQTLDTNSDVITSQSDREDTFAGVAVTGDNVIVKLFCTVDALGELGVTAIFLQCYYA